MKFVDEFREKETAKQIIKNILAEVNSDREYRLMEFCGGHTHAISRHGLQNLLPSNVRYIHGPGCPVCILPSGRIAAMMDLLERESITLCTFGDVLRVPTQAGKSLQIQKAKGADIRVVYSPLDCIKIAQQQEKPVVFFAVGFETTAPATAALLKQARALDLKNLFVYCNHVLTPAALKALLSSDESAVNFNGLIGPSHVSTITGTKIYNEFALAHKMPIVVAGFEPLDVLQSTLMLIRQINQGTSVVENEYSRAVTEDGNRIAQNLMADVFVVRDQFEWRGLGLLPNSGMALGESYSAFDAERHFFVPQLKVSDIKSCECPAVLRGIKQPQDCKLFGTICRPDNPMGACMVSSEGACAAQWQYQRFAS